MRIAKRERPGRVAPDTCRVTHSDPYARLELDLVVRVHGPGGEVLDVPEVLDVLAFRVYDAPGPHGFVTGHGFRVPPEVGHVLALGFAQRLRADKALRRWLIAVTFEAQMGIARTRREDAS